MTIIGLTLDVALFAELDGSIKVEQNAEQVEKEFGDIAKRQCNELG